MPLFQLMLGRINKVMDHPAITEVDKSLFDGERTLAELAAEHDIAASELEAKFIAGIPRGMQEMVRALIRDNLERETPLAMTFAWAPGYDYELTAWEAPGTDVSPGGITVLFRSRYPGDAHPSAKT